jgi:hypothetical protein
MIQWSMVEISLEEWKFINSLAAIIGGNLVGGLLVALGIACNQLLMAPSSSLRWVIGAAAGYPVSQSIVSLVRSFSARLI